jgi:AAA family ATP:ADP antiporter
VAPVAGPDSAHKMSRSMSGLKNLTHNVLKVRQGEYRRTAFMFLVLLTLVASFVTGRIIRDTLFLDIPDIKAKLPIMYVVASVAVAIVATIVSRIADRVSRTSFMIASIVIMISTLIASRFVIEARTQWFPYVFYVWIDVFGSVMVVQFWTFAQEVFNAREAKRLFALIGGGGVVATILVGVGVGQNAKWLGLANLLYVLVGILALCALALVFAKRAAGKPEPRAAFGKGTKKAGNVFSSRYLLLIAATTVSTFLASTLGDYEFKLIVSEAIQDRDARAAYFGTFYGVTGLISAFVQFFLTSRILEKAGILPALVLLPVSLLGGAIAVFVSPVLAAASALKGAENTLRYTINDATTQLLYLPIAKEQRARAKAFIDGLLRPLAVGLAGLTLFFLSSYMTHRRVTVALAVVCVVWGLLIVALRSEYLKTLLTTLKQRRLDFEGVAYAKTDEGTLRAFAETLKTGSPEEMLTVLDLLGSSELEPNQIESLVLPLLKHPDDDVKIATLNFLGTRARPELARRMEPLFDAPSEPVRAAAVSAFCSLARDDAAIVLERFLDDQSLLVQGATVAGLIKNGGLEGVLTAADQLKAMIEDPRPEVRERAAWILGEISVSGFYRPLVALLNDPVQMVRQSAIAAAGKLRTLKLLEPLLVLMADERVAPLTVDALASYGSNIEPQILAAFLAPKQSSRVRAHLCRVLQRIGGSDSARVFVSDLPLAGDRLRTQAMHAAVRIVARKPEVRPDLGLVSRALFRESDNYLQALVMEREIGECSDLLQSELRDRAEDALQRIFCALSFTYPAQTLEIVQANLTSTDANVRANAVEVLDNMLEADHKALILPLVDEGAVRQMLDSQQVKSGVISHSRNEWLRELLDDREPWMVVASLHTIGSYRIPGIDKPMSKCLSHEEPWVRETALWALKTTLPPELLPQKAQKLIGDEVERVRHYGEHVLAEIEMISNVEKVLFLKKIDLFRRIRGDDLARIANIAEELSFTDQERVFNEGDLGDALYLIVTGKAKIHKGETQLAVLGERQCFGEIAILDSEPRSASVTAVEPLLTLKIRRDDFSEIMAQKPEIAQGVIKVLCGRLRNANKR